MRAAFGLLPVGRQLAALGGSRVLFRGVAAVLPLALLTHWSSAEFAGYASAMGRVAFTTQLVSCGAEKSVLLLMPRAHRLRRQLLGAHLLLMLASALIVLTVGVVLLAPIAAWLTLLALAQALLLGVVLTQATVLRSLGHSTPESAAIGALAPGVLLGLGAVWFLGWGAHALLAWWVFYLVIVAGALASRLRIEAPTRPQQAVARAVLGRAARMGVGDIVASAGLSAVYAALSFTGHDVGLARLYTVMAVLSLALNALVYLTRLAQPELSRRRPSRRWRREGLAVNRFVIPAGLLAVVVSGAASVHAARSSWLPGLLPLAVLVASIVPLLMSVALAHFAFENGDRRTLGLTARFAVVAFVVTVGVALVLTGRLGVVGGVDAVVMGELTHGLLLGRAARSLHRSPVTAQAGAR